MQNEWQHRPMHQALGSTPVYMVHPMVPSWLVYNDYQPPQIQNQSHSATNIIVTTTSMLPTSSHDSSTH